MPSRPAIDTPRGSAAADRQAYSAEGTSYRALPRGYPRVGAAGAGGAADSTESLYGLRRGELQVEADCRGSAGAFPAAQRQGRSEAAPQVTGCDPVGGGTAGCRTDSALPRIYSLRPISRNRSWRRNCVAARGAPHSDPKRGYTPRRAACVHVVAQRSDSYNTTGAGAGAPVGGHRLGYA